MTPAHLRALRLCGLLTASALGGCANLPSSGPTAHDILDQQARGDAIGFHVVDIDPAAVASLQADGGAHPPGLASLDRAGEVDAIGAGDVLQITVFEVGAKLFSAGPPSQADGEPGAPPSAAGETFPAVAVGRDGSVTLPYAGRMEVAGRTPQDVQAMIAAALKAKSQAPQVIVSVKENVANTVVVMGDVKKPGRLPLDLARSRLLDAVATAGGGAYPTQDLVVRVRRGERSAEMRLDAVRPGEADDLLLLPQDRIELIYAPRSFTIFGATKATETPFQTPTVSLAQAVARSGGPLDQQADPTAVFVFRYDRTEPDGAPLPGARPIAYRLDMMKAQSYFLAQRFDIHPRDVIYIANAFR